jgi:hypothetical protein
MPADAVPNGSSVLDGATGQVLPSYQNVQAMFAADPLEFLDPISPTDIRQVEYDVIDRNLVVSTIVASFVISTVDVYYEVLIDLDNNLFTGALVRDPLNFQNAVGADFIMRVFSFDGGLGPVYFANLQRPDAIIELHEALVNFFPVQVQGTGGGFILTIPLELLSGFGIDVSTLQQFRFLVASGNLQGVGRIDFAPSAPVIVSLTPPPPLSGDYNRSGNVDQADYTTWKASFGNLVSPGTGADGNGNGVVDAADYIIWRNHLGRPTAASLVAPASKQSAPTENSTSAVSTLQYFVPSPTNSSPRFARKLPVSIEVDSNILSQNSRELDLLIDNVSQRTKRADNSIEFAVRIYDRFFESARSLKVAIDEAFAELPILQ